MLQILGLSAAAESVYADLVGHPDPDVAATAAHRVVDPAAVVAELEDKGLIIARVGAPGRYAVTPPAVALENLLATQRYALRQAESAVADLAEAYRAGRAADAAPGLVEVVSGRAAMRRRFERMRLEAGEEVVALVTAWRFSIGVDPARPGDAPAPGRPVSRPLRYRVVVERDVLDTPGAVSRIAQVIGAREQLRVAHRVPAQVVVADRTRAMVPLSGTAALVTQAPALVAALLAAFEAAWQHAQPVWLDSSRPTVSVVPAQGSPGEPDPLDLRVLALLLIGSTDAAVAGQLGLGLRTVQRRIRRLMELAGVDTRIQLGWQARERGWIRS